MKLFGSRQKYAEKETAPDQTEEYVVSTFSPNHIRMTKDIVRRQREEYLWGKYCKLPFSV